jgi:hypothetical protein
MIRLYTDSNETFANIKKGKPGESRGRKATGANVQSRHYASQLPNLREFMPLFGKRGFLS